MVPYQKTRNPAIVKQTLIIHHMKQIIGRLRRPEVRLPDSEPFCDSRFDSPCVLDGIAARRNSRPTCMEKVVRFLDLYRMENYGSTRCMFLFQKAD